MMDSTGTTGQHSCILFPRAHHQIRDNNDVMQSQLSTQSSLSTGSVSSAMQQHQQQRRVSLAAARLTPSSDTGDMGSADDDVVRYGSVVRLWAASQYARGGQGGYVGYYRKSVNGGGRQKRRNGGPFVAIPPFDAIRQEHFTPSCFQVKLS